MSMPQDINDMWLLLRVLSEGKARFEKSGSLREFCFEGIRYAYNDDPTMTAAVVGRDRLKAALLP